MTDSSSSQPQLTETKLRIPFPSSSSPQLHIIGILAEHSTASSSSSASRKPLALITHGILAHKDQAYHKELAKRLPIDSFRFDFRANGETPGEWGMSNFENDSEDINCVLGYLAREYGYDLDLFVGHSRGSLSGWQWFAKQYGSEEGKERVEGVPERSPCWVSLGGRWRMERIHDRDKVYNPAFEKDGFYAWKAKVAGQPVEVHITPDQVKAFEEYPISDYVSQFPAESDTLLIHGTSDETVPCPDVGYYLNALTSRTDRQPGQTQIHLVENAGHMFKGHYEEVATIITQWYHSRRGHLITSQIPSSQQTPPEDLALEAKQQGDVLERSWREKSGKL